MGMRLRPIGEMGIATGRSERVRCWKCHTSFEVERRVTRARCPECGSAVALHRLNMPVMPTGRAKKQVVRLPAKRVEGAEREVRKRRVEMTVLNNGTDLAEPEGEREGEDTADRRAPFEPRRRIEERREVMFSEAEPLREGVEEGPEFSGITFKTLVVSIGFAALFFLAVAYVLGGG